MKVYDLVDCTSCKQRHNGIHVLTEAGVTWYFCPVTEDRVPLTLEPLQPA